MPVLALGEYGNGRTIALAVDGTHKLRFSPFALRAGGRAHGALWDALLGWLMRDPRFEPAVAELPDGCIAGMPTTLLLRPVFGGAASDRPTHASLDVGEMGRDKLVKTLEVELPPGAAAVPVELGPLAAGAYAVTVRLQQQGTSAPSRYEFACEAGGVEWADPRPDAARLAQISASTGGVAVDSTGIDSIPIPKSALVVSQRTVEPMWPVWRWALCAACAMGAHWVLRRRAGLS